MRVLMRSLLASESGTTAVEYALIASLISIVIAGGATSIGTSLNAKFGDVAAAF